MATLGSLVVKVGADISGLDRGLRSASSSIQAAGRSMVKVGAGMTAAVSVPLLAVASSAISAATEMNGLMANVQSLGLEAERVEELKTVVQELAVETGKSTSDLAGGLYQVVSAFGDTADTAAILETNAKAAAAGLATTEDAINLTSAVTKGYGDTSAGAVQHVSDLALLTVQLGQTTFPELAASMGKVVPIAANLGASQEELFAIMATATGVTGNAAEVSTQMRGAMQALMVPTAATTALMADLGFESGAAMIEQLGLTGSLQTMVAAAEKSGMPLQSYISSIEGQTLALALSGAQAEVFEDKLEAMGGAVGATEAAFRAQTEGINAAGFSMAQLQVRAQVLKQRLGDALAPALGVVLAALEPVVVWVERMIGKFAGADSKTQLFVAALGGLLVAAGPVLMVLGAMVTAIGAIGLPVLAVIAAVGLLAAAWAADFGGIQAKTGAIVDGIKSRLEPMRAWLAEKIPGWVESARAAFETVLGWVQAAKEGDFAPLLSGLGSAFNSALTSISTTIQEFSWDDWISGVLEWDVVTTLLDWGAWIVSLDWSAIVTEYLAWADYVQTLAWDMLVTAFTSWADYVQALDWSAVVATLSDWGAWIASLDWTAIVVQMLDWATWIPAMVWNGFVTILDWMTFVVNLVWTEWLSELSWADFVERWNSWGDKISEVSWADRIQKFTDWASYVFALTWSSFVDKLEWPIIASFNWSDWISGFSWPSLPSFPGWGALFGGGGGDDGRSAVLPVGLSGLAAVGAGGSAGGSVNVTVNATVAGDVDVERMAYRVAEVINRRRR